ncbi:membrane protein required for colicin V production [Apibacter mensalis]|uniref:Membrane protein required for colicin V production n=1 Tax=Apibacter mensalis TaxID=1586267 RepID=A0A0X3AQX2_9FLAO|nr:CvpA family protein [Apibacter mensalis]CVK16811.1 membrane protein required for colicin V production [Apibacter mensalis]
MIYEYILLGGTIMGAIVGYIKGFLKQISSIAGLTVGYFFSSLFLPQLHELLLRNRIISKETSVWVSFFCIFLILFISILFLSRFIERILKKLGLGFTNQFAGMVLGALKYFLIIMILYCLFYFLNIITEENCSINLLNFVSLFKAVIFKYVQ